MHVKMESEIGVMDLQAKECLRLPEARRGKEGSTSRTFRGSMALSTIWFQTSGLQNYETVNLCCLKPPSLWYFVTAAPGNSYGRESIANALLSQLLLSATDCLKSWDCPPVSNINLISRQSGQDKKGRGVYPPPHHLSVVRGLPQGVLIPAHTFLPMCKASLVISCALNLTRKPGNGSKRPITDMR